MNQLTKDEIKVIKHWYKSFSPELVKPEKEARDKEVDTVIIISRGLKHIHSSKYPIMTTIGVRNGDSPEYYDLGTFHDTIEVDSGRVGIDSLGKNVFHIWPKDFKTWKVAGFFSPISSLHLGNGHFGSKPERKEAIT